MNLKEHELTHNKEASNLNIFGKYTQNNNQIYTKYLLINYDCENKTVQD